MRRNLLLFGVLVLAHASVFACSNVTGAGDLSTDDDEDSTLPKRPKASSTTQDTGARQDAAAVPAPITNGDASASLDGGQAGTEVFCGGKVCSGATPVCCAAYGSYVCVATTGTCVSSRMRLDCDDVTDCRPGEVCCNFEAEWRSRCAPAIQCRGSRDYREAVMCRSHPDCPAGERCDGWLGETADRRYDLTSGICIRPF